MKIAIIGGGISGLFTAYELGRAGHEVVVISPDKGGLIRSHKNNGFSFDFGGHVYNVNSPYISGWMPHLRGAKVHSDRRAYYFKHEEGGHLSSIIEYPVQSHVNQLGIELTGDGNGEYLGESLEKWGRRVFGPQFYNEWFGPFNRRVWSANPQLMDSDWIANRVQLPTERKQGWGPNASFVYAPGNAITDYLVSMAQSVGVVFVNDLAFLSKSAVTNKCLQLPSGDIHFDKVICTTLIGNVASRLFGASMDYTFHTNTVITVGIGFEGNLGLDFHWAYNDVRGEVHRVTNLSEYSPDNAPAGCSSLMFEIPVPHAFAGPLASTLVHRIDANNWPQVTHNSLEKKMTDWILADSGLSYLVTDRNRVAATTFMAFTGYPIPTLGCRHAVADIKLRLLDAGVYTIGRWGSHGYFNMEHCAAEAALMPALIEGDGDRTAYLQSSFYYGKRTI